MNLLHDFQKIYSLYIVCPAFVLGWVLCFVGLSYSEKLKHFLIANKSERWNELRENETIVFGKKIYRRNGSKFFGYVFGPVDDEDQEVLQLKLIIRKYIKIGLFLLIVPFCVFFLLYVICLF
jgi:hypothetical protein